MTNMTIVCQVAQDKYENAALWRNLWTILLWAFGAAVVVFLVLAMWFFIQQNWLPAALTTVGTIAEGAAIRWIVNRRTDAVDEEEKAYKQVEEKCQNVVVANQLRNHLKLFGQFY